MQGLSVTGSETSVMAEQAHVARRGMVWLAGYVVVSAAVYSVADIYFYELNSVYLTTSIAVWVLGYVLLVLLMRASARDDGRHGGGIAGYLGLSFLTGIAIGVGIVLLVLPGLYLMMRWLPAYARLQARGDSVTDAMSWSWEHTAPIQKQLVVAMLGPLAAYVVLFAIAVAQGFYAEDWSLGWYNVSLFVLNTATSVAIAWLQLLGVAVYRVIERGHSEPAEVFS